MTLFLFTNSFPCNKALEHYIEHELPYLSSQFDTIYILPGDFGKIEIPVPNNVHVLNIYSSEFYKGSKMSFIANLPLILFLCFFEFVNTKLGKLYWLKKAKSAVISLNNAIESSKALSNIMNSKNLDKSNCIFYSYWFYHSALILALAKKKNIINSFVSRGHQAEIYEEQEPHKSLFKNVKLKYVDRLCLISEHAKLYIQNNYPFSKSKLEVSYLGVKDHGLNPEKSEVFTIVSCSKYAPHKRIHLIVESLKRINDNYNWYHLGFIPDAIQEEFKNQLKENKNKNVFFPGDLSNQKVLEFYKSTPIDLFINVSSIEGLSVAIMEAISFGIPVIGTDINGTREIVTNESGYLMPINFDTVELAETIKTVQQRKNTIKRKGGRQLFLEKFNAETNFNYFIQNTLLKFVSKTNVN